MGAAIINFQQTQCDDATSLRIFSDIDTAMKMLAAELGVTGYEGLRYTPNEKHLIRKHDRRGKVIPDVFLIPYNRAGMYDPDWVMEYDLRPEKQFVILKGRDRGLFGKVWRNS